MKKSMYAAIILLTMAVLFSFTTKRAYNPKPVEKKRFSCGVPTSLGATLSGTWMVLNWTIGSNDVGFHPGGYYNYHDASGNHFVPFSFNTNTQPYGFSVPSGVYSITFQVTADCLGGGSVTSGPFSRTFP